MCYCYGITVCNTHPIPTQVDIVCGTPGRLDDMISTGKLDLSNVSTGWTHTLVLCDNRKSVIIAVINIIVIVIIEFLIIVIGNCSEVTFNHCKNFAFSREISY